MNEYFKDTSKVYVQNISIMQQYDWIPAIVFFIGKDRIRKDDPLLYPTIVCLMNDKRTKEGILNVVQMKQKIQHVASGEDEGSTKKSFFKVSDFDV